MSRRTRTPRVATAHERNTVPMPAPNERIDTNGQVTWLRVDRLTVDPAVGGGYQRALNPRKVKAIAKELDPDALGVLTVSRREDGSLVIIDGQQRQGALMSI